MDPNTFPTKGNLIAAKNSLKLATMGYGLMDKKRNILIRELMGLIDEAKGIQSEIDTVFKAAYEALQSANIELGINYVQEIGMSVPVDDTVKIKARSIMGTEIPLVQHQEKPMELAYVDVPEEYTGVVIQKLTSRKGALQGMSQAAGGYSRLEFSIPSRGLIGYRGDFMTDTKGNGILNTIFDGYAEYKGDIAYRQTGSLIAFEAGESITYGLFNAQERGTLFIGPGVKVYSGMVIGQSPKAEDVEINVCKTKKLTNTRSSSADEALKLTPPKIMSLEQCLDFIDTDELLEVTPESLRIRKKILDPTLRKRASFKNK